MLANNRTSNFVLFLITALLISGCQQVQNITQPTVAPASLRDVPAQRLGYRFEADILAPPEVEAAQNAQIEKLTAIQADFDQNRATEVLERTILSPDKQRALAIYQKVADVPGNFRLDLYDPSGKIIRKITPENLTLRFPDSVVWSPDSANFVFAGARRENTAANQEIVQEAPRPDIEENQTPDANANVAPAPQPSPPATVLTFRTEQIYLANRDGGELKPLTQTDGLIYFYFVWSPDSTMLAALACKENEWQVLQMKAENAGEVFKPLGRPRLLEKNGRERRLDDGLTGVLPVWSPDSSKVATAFDKQVRIYDAIGNNPTAASIPLQVPLILASKICDDKIAANQSCIIATSNESNANNATNLPTQEPVTFLPVVTLRWTEDKTLYVQTGKFVDFVQGDPLRSFPRWHRLNLSAQVATLK